MGTNLNEIKDKELLHCGDCVYLETKPAYREWYDNPEAHMEGWIHNKQENRCLLKSGVTIHVWDRIRSESGKRKLIGKYDWYWLEDGKNPKRLPGCLQFAKHIKAKVLAEKAA